MLFGERGGDGGDGGWIVSHAVDDEEDGDDDDDDVDVDYNNDELLSFLRRIQETSEEGQIQSQQMQVQEETMRDEGAEQNPQA